ncbi:hypothetical protein CHLNCDRAFT_135081 [Chlorella variabilis]|uniref:Cyclic nucleotide-binding domain-containing protein n=1 Tax=Chlorella variabilis TaxID=554065 RepID=E1ZHG8_CHLVA|nr:hypothetical protein CHLNCDRAFT_135081 [Chlorella variabilis]EFN54600.1 hypothetical protein CHLNCDRAFT_135081 [Chlorella variabilis]|eukprot:XP_005846702.1 hypothetical protein CHLNCDRAFT_135081 [Chlorella variabilis]
MGSACTKGVKSTATVSPAPEPARDPPVRSLKRLDTPGPGYRSKRRGSVSAEPSGGRASLPPTRQSIAKLAHSTLKIQELVRSTLLFKELDEEQEACIIDAMFERRVAAGEVVIREGEEADNFYVIESGTFAASKAGADGGPPEWVTTYEGKGAFGELALMYNCPRAATVTGGWEPPGEEEAVAEGAARRRGSRDGGDAAAVPEPAAEAAAAEPEKPPASRTPEPAPAPGSPSHSGAAALLPGSPRPPLRLSDNSFSRRRSGRSAGARSAASSSDGEAASAGGSPTALSPLAPAQQPGGDGCGAGKPASPAVGDAGAGQESGEESPAMTVLPPIAEEPVEGGGLSRTTSKGRPRGSSAASAASSAGKAAPPKKAAPAAPAGKAKKGGPAAGPRTGGK